MAVMVWIEAVIETPPPSVEPGWGVLETDFQ
jgi:hypothetical protein